jgi:flagellar hook-associated protein 2
MSSSGISFSLSPNTSGSTAGLGQGIDVNSVVSQLISAARAPEQVWVGQRSTLASQAAALTLINSNLSNFADAVNALKDPLGALIAKAAVSSNTGLLTASAQTTAAEGSHVVVINNLATTSSAYTDAVPTGSTLDPGTITLQVGSGQPASITIDSGNNTLDSLASYINAQNLEVSASVINDANGSRLALVSNTIGQPGDLTLSAGGAAGTPSYAGVGDGTISDLAGGTGSVNENITITATDATHFDVAGSVSGPLGTATVGTPFSSNQISFTLAAGNTDFQAGDQFTVATTPPPLTFHEIAGNNASLTVDGIPISNTSNTVTGVIPGVTLDLLSDVSHEEIHLSVAPDSSQATQAITNFVSSYNQLIGSINAQFSVPSDGRAAPPLESNGSLRLLQSSLLQGITYAISGNDGFVNLASLGINLANDGTLSVDSGKLNTAIAQNTDFQNFFQSLDPANLGFAQGLSTTLSNQTSLTQGLLNLELTENAAVDTALTNQINDFEDRLAITQQQLITKFSQINAALEQLPLIQNQIAGALGTLPK